MDVDSKEFRAGVVWAVAELNRGHDDPVCCSDILLASGFTFQELKEASMSYDFDEIAAFIPRESPVDIGKS